jgi:Flp pilus assembly protein TadD
VIRSSQGSSRHINALGVLYARYGMLDKAEAQFQKATARLNPEDLKIRICLARTCHELGNHEEAGRRG